MYYPTATADIRIDSLERFRELLDEFKDLMKGNAYFKLRHTVNTLQKNQFNDNYNFNALYFTLHAEMDNIQCPIVYSLLLRITPHICNGLEIPSIYKSFSKKN